MPISAARLEELKKRADQNIDYGDIPELDETFFKNAKLVEPAHKEQVTMRIDHPHTMPSRDILKDP